MEEWRPIKKSRGQYEASSEGRIRNARTGRILKPCIAVRRYLVSLNGFMSWKSYPVARLVYIAFYGETKSAVRHKNRICTDNRIENLYITEE